MRSTGSASGSFFRRERVRRRVSLRAFLPLDCEALRDCACCGANMGLVCVEPYDHGGIHMFQCRRCGRDKDC